MRQAKHRYGEEPWIAASGANQHSSQVRARASDARSRRCWRKKVATSSWLRAMPPVSRRPLPRSRQGQCARHGHGGGPFTVCRPGPPCPRLRRRRHPHQQCRCQSAGRDRRGVGRGLAQCLEPQDVRLHQHDPPFLSAHEGAARGCDRQCHREFRRAHAVELYSRLDRERRPDGADTRARGAHPISMCASSPSIPA